MVDEKQQSTKEQQEKVENLSNLNNQINLVGESSPQVFRWRVKLSILGHSAWLSHLDLLRSVERALRRGKLPLRYSEGFNPHLLISWGPAHPVGLASLGEYFDVDFIANPPRDWVEEINKLMPLGLRIEGAKEIELSAPSLMASINRAIYKISLEGIEEEVLAECCLKLLELDEVMVLRRSPKGDKIVDIRPGLFSLIAEGNTVFALCLMGGKGSPKPKEIAESIANIASKGIVGEILRTELYIDNESGKTALIGKCNV